MPATILAIKVVQKVMVKPNKWTQVACVRTAEQIIVSTGNIMSHLEVQIELGWFNLAIFGLCPFCHCIGQLKALFMSFCKTFITLLVSKPNAP